MESPVAITYMPSSIPNKLSIALITIYYYNAHHPLSLTCPTGLLKNLRVLLMMVSRLRKCASW